MLVIIIYRKTKTFIKTKKQHIINSFNWKIYNRSTKEKRSKKNPFSSHKPYLIHHFKYMFSVFKQHYTYFYILFHLHVFSKKTKNYCLGTCTKWAFFFFFFLTFPLLSKHRATFLHGLRSIIRI